MNGWYVAKSKPRKEDWLITSLTQLGVEVFYPRIRARKRGKLLTEPLFPTYLFCHFDGAPTNWPAIRWAPGLNYFLSTDRIPTRVPDEMMAFLDEQVKRWNGEGHKERSLKTGDTVVVDNGPFAGLEGIFQAYIGPRQRCKILIQTMGRLATVELPESDLAMVMLTL